MKAYRISFSAPGGAKAATGSFFCLSDDQAIASAARLLRDSARFDAVEVVADNRVVASVSRDDLAA